MLSSVSHLALSVKLLFLFSLAWPVQAQTPCPSSDTCPGSAAQMVCPAPGTTLTGNDVTFTWCNANANYFLDIESVPGAHDIFYAWVSFQNFVHLINLPTNGRTIHVILWTQIHGQWQTPLEYNEVNVAPVLTVPADQTTTASTLLSISASATDADLPANPLTFALPFAPRGMTINPATGLITWTPREGEDPSANVVQVSVTDTNAAAVNAKSLSVTQSFVVTVPCPS